ncbi:deoxyribonuclease V [Nitrosomonas sp. Nm166]|uniref:deoxyribonuclease V n=1 Tax=Nitrosomonas sp. Nm166 TaxID=1881054 RepID=UPI0008F024E9|nr:deoxyribonuclease V [Nitrosomonas sp. Nm166]SFF10294.1 deoxyribonuclease V [Nitrosomonas sp. Nm166]
MIITSHLHDWNVTPQQAVAIQERMRHFVETADRLPEIFHVAGVDVGLEESGQIARAAVVVLSFPNLKRVDQAIARRPVEFPYIPGLLSFRELPAVLDALARLHIQPDIILCDGQGIAHPRRLGIASHLGVLLDVPTIGVGKTRLTGYHIEPPDERGGWVPLQDKGEVIGAVLRTRPGVKPVYVSLGHRLTLQTAIQMVMACTTRYRLPETTRQAHKLASGHS